MDKNLIQYNRQCWPWSEYYHYQ